MPWLLFGVGVLVGIFAILIFAIMKAGSDADDAQLGTDQYYIGDWKRYHR